MTYPIEYNSNHLYRGVTPEQEATNQRLIAEAVDKFNRRPGPRVGDFVQMPASEYYAPGLYRITYDWGDEVQATSYPTDGNGGGFYLDGGHADYSGGLRGSVKKADLVDTGETKVAKFWMFNEGDVKAHNGIFYSFPVRVYTQKGGH